jgi:hypothetical protein
MNALLLLRGALSSRGARSPAANTLSTRMVRPSRSCHHPHVASASSACASTSLRVCCCPHSSVRSVTTCGFYSPHDAACSMCDVLVKQS